MDQTTVTPDIILLHGAITTVLLRHENRAVLFNCCDQITPDFIHSLGIDSIEHIFCTQYHRSHVMGISEWLPSGTKVWASESEKMLFENVESYWSDERNRWHRYHAHPGPQVPTHSIPVHFAVRDGDSFEWHRFQITAMATPGPTPGSLTWILDSTDMRLAICGDLMCSPEKIPDLYSLQKGRGLMDYHGFLGALPELRESLNRLATSGAKFIIPAHGKPFENPQSSITMLQKKLDDLWQNYISISSIRFYYSQTVEGTFNPACVMPPAQEASCPEWLTRIPETTSSLIRSKTGATFLVDCGGSPAVEYIRREISAGKIASLDGVWISHYHDDHIDGLNQLIAEFQCPIYADSHLAEILSQPERFFLPCLSPNPNPPDKITTDGESWTWREFQLTSFHFPGQSEYHAALTIECLGRKLLLAGDSFSPTGIDDYCPHNRNFLGPGRGFAKCLDLIEKLRPDAIFNQHQTKPFVFTDNEINFIRARLTERKKLIEEITPWDNANFALDPWWIHAYPYEQTVAAGDSAYATVMFTNHSDNCAIAQASLVLPIGWTTSPVMTDKCEIPPVSNGQISFQITTTKNSPAGMNIIPILATWNNQYLGAIANACIRIK